MKREYNEERILGTVMSMFEDIVEDDTSPDCFNLDVESDCWISSDDGAIFQLSPYNRTTIDMHCYIPKNIRCNSEKLGKEALKWLKDNAPSMYSKVITTTPSFNRHISIFLLRMGFKEEGRITKCFTKNGVQHDIIYYGLSRGGI